MPFIAFRYRTWSNSAFLSKELKKNQSIKNAEFRKGSANFARKLLLLVLLVILIHQCCLHFAQFPFPTSLHWSFINNIGSNRICDECALFVNTNDDPAIAQFNTTEAQPAPPIQTDLSNFCTKIPKVKSALERKDSQNNALNAQRFDINKENDEGGDVDHCNDKMSVDFLLN